MALKRRLISGFFALLCVVSLILPAQKPVQAAGKKLVALTFDDGPGPYTNRLLDGLAARGVQATFFTLGQRAEIYPNVIRRIYTEGHQICGHSYDHPDFGSLGTAGALRQVEKSDGIVNRTIGGSEKYLLRAPYGNTNRDFLSKVGRPVVYWSVDPQDWLYLNSTYVKNAIVNNAFDGAIILVHDIHSTSVDGALAAIDVLKSRGYEFVTIRELFRRRAVEMKNGTVYYSCKPNGKDLGAVDAPKITAESISGGFKITITAGEGVPIYYTTDGKPVGYGSNIYQGPFEVKRDCTIRTVAAYHLNGGRSAETKYKYTPPQAGQVGLEITENTLNFLNIKAGDTVYYTLNGSDPRKNGIPFTGPVAIQPGSNLAFYTGGEDRTPTATTMLFYTHEGNLFSDIKPTAWYYKYVDTVAARGYMNGTGKYIFNPGGKLTRGMVVEILFRMSEEAAPGKRTNTFADVKKTDYFCDAVEWAYVNQIVNGVSSKAFQPNRNINREELAKMMVCFLRYKGVELPKGTGLVKGYTDRGRISSWATASVEVMAQLELMIGDTSKRFNPQNTATRAEGATVLCRLCELF